MFIGLAPSIEINLSFIKLRIDITWLLGLPLTWAIAKIYVPILDSSVSELQAWLVAAISLLFILVSLLIHVTGHVVAAKVLKQPIPKKIPLYLLADPAQAWSAAKSPGREVLIALAGPFIQLLLAAFAFYVWNLQLSSSSDLVALFLAGFNLAIAAINLIPAFPLDGGRLVRSIIWTFLGRPTRGEWLAKWLGFWLILGITLWGLLLVAEQARLVWQAGSICFVEAGLIAISLLLAKPAYSTEPNEEVRVESGFLWRNFVAAITLVPLLLITTSLMPLNMGLRAPGITVPVQPMVQVPPQYLHESTGSVILTTVIPHAPILLVEWIYAQFDNSVEIVSEEKIIPPNETIQSKAERDHHMLVESTTLAIAEGLRLAGFDVVKSTDGVTILSILPDSPSSSTLMTGDVIKEINGQPIDSINDLKAVLLTLEEREVIQLGIIRENVSLSVTTITMSPSEEGGPVRIGVGVENHLENVQLPFPVTITPERILGGPSAALMFSLGVYDLVTPGDLTGGRCIAGTGTIDIDGNIGPIGGVKQKVVAAERAGAEYFLCPVGNYEDALAAAKNITVIKVSTVQEAIDFLENLPLGA